MEPTILSNVNVFQKTLLTPLGEMVAMADEHQLLLLEFADRTQIDVQFSTLRALTGRLPAAGTNAVLGQTQRELNEYFEGCRTEFTVPVMIQGTSFQELVWNELKQISFGETSSYQQLGERIGQPQAARAIGTANGQNRLAIVIPCHRVIRADGTLSGYAGGVKRKKWLLDHEQQTLF